MWKVKLNVLIFWQEVTDDFASSLFINALKFNLSVCVCACRVGWNVLQESSVAYTTPVDSQQPALQDGHVYLTLDHMQQQMPAITGKPVYEFVPDHNQQPLQEDDRAYYSIGKTGMCGFIRTSVNYWLKFKIARVFMGKVDVGSNINCFWFSPHIMVWPCTYCIWTDSVDVMYAYSDKHAWYLQ